MPFLTAARFMHGLWRRDGVGDTGVSLFRQNLKKPDARRKSQDHDLS